MSIWSSLDPEVMGLRADRSPEVRSEDETPDAMVDVAHAIPWHRLIRLCSFSDRGNEDEVLLTPEMARRLAANLTRAADEVEAGHGR